MSVKPKIILQFFHPELVEGRQILRSIILFCLMLAVQFQVAAFPFFSPKPQFTLMLDPAGDAHHHGRKIDDTYERSVSLQCAELLQKKIQERYPHVAVLLARTAGDTVAPLQNANFANRSKVNCFISLSFYQEKKIQPQLYVYYFSYGNDFIARTLDLTLYDYDQAHIANLPTMHQWASFLRQTLEQPINRSIFEFNGIAKLPLKPLIGIQAPAFLIEMGIRNKEGWMDYIEPILASLDRIIKSSV